MNRREQFLSNVVVLDTETTDLDFRKAEIVETGVALYLGGKWEIIETLYKPVMHITPDVSFITNITPSMVKDKEYFGKAVVTDLNPILDAFVGVGNIVAHNAFYDESVLKNYAMTNLQTPWICTMRMAKKLYSEDNSVSMLKLGYLRYRFELDIPEGMLAHRAGADAFMTGKLLEFLVTELESRGILNQDSPYSEQIVKWLEEPIIYEYMPIGKHKGTKMTDVPLSYWNWALSNMDSLDENKPEYDSDFAASVANAVEYILENS